MRFQYIFLTNKFLFVLNIEYKKKINESTVSDTFLKGIEVSYKQHCLSSSFIVWYANPGNKNIFKMHENA